MTFFSVSLFLLVVGLVLSTVQFIKNLKQQSFRSLYEDYFKTLIIYLFAIVFCMKQVFPDITWL